MVEQFAADLLSDSVASEMQCLTCSVDALNEWYTDSDIQGESELQLFFINYARILSHYGRDRLTVSTTLKTIEDIGTTMPDVGLSRVNAGKILETYDACPIQQSIVINVHEAIAEVCKSRGANLISNPESADLKQFSYSFFKLSTEDDSLSFTVGNVTIDLSDAETLTSADDTTPLSVNVCSVRLVVPKDDESAPGRALSYDELPDNRNKCLKDPISFNPNLTDENGTLLKFSKPVTITFAQEEIPEECELGITLYYDSTEELYVVFNGTPDDEGNRRLQGTQDIVKTTTKNAPIYILFRDKIWHDIAFDRIYHSSGFITRHFDSDIERYDSPFFIAALSIFVTLILAVILIYHQRSREMTDSLIYREKIIQTEDYLQKNNFKRLHLWVSCVASAGLKLPSTFILITYINFVCTCVGLGVMTTGEATNSKCQDVSEILSLTFAGFGLLLLIGAWALTSVLSFVLWQMILKGDDKMRTEQWVMLVVLNWVCSAVSLVLTGQMCCEAMQLWSSIILSTIVMDALFIQSMLCLFKYIFVSKKAEKINDVRQLIEDVNLALEDDELIF